MHAFVLLVDECLAGRPLPRGETPGTLELRLDDEVLHYELRHEGCARLPAPAPADLVWFASGPELDRLLGEDALSAPLRCQGDARLFNALASMLREPPNALSLRTRSTPERPAKSR